MKDVSPSIAVISNSGESLVRFRGSLLRLLSGRGHKVVVFAPDYTPLQRDALHAAGVDAKTFPLDRAGRNPLSELRSIRSLTRCFLRDRPDVSLTYFIKPNIYGGLAAAFSRTPRRVAMVEGLGYLFTDDSEEKLKKRLTRTFTVMLLRLSLRMSHKVIFLNPDDRDEFIERGIVQNDRAMVLGGIGVNLEEYMRVPLPVGGPSFLMVARLLREKGVIEYIKAARLIKADYPTARFCLAGGIDVNPGGISRDEMLDLTADGAVEWLGELADVRPAVAQSSVYVLPSYYREGVPRSTQEAMAMGRAVITTDVPGCRETLVTDVNGFLVKPRDVADLAHAMQRFCDDPMLAAKMGKESRSLAEQRFDERRSNEAIYRVLLPNSSS